MIKIVKNTTIADIEIYETGVTIPASGQLTIDPINYGLWTQGIAESIDDNTQFHQDIDSGDIVINNGEEDLTAFFGKIQLQYIDPIVCYTKVHVGKSGSDTIGDGTLHSPYLTIAKAISTITDASYSNPYAITICTGFFSEPLLTLTTGISLIALSDETTAIIPDGDHDAVHIIGHKVAIYNIEIEDVPTGRWAIKIDSLSIDTECELVNVELDDCDNGIYIKTTTNTVHLDVNDMTITGDYSKGIEILSSGGKDTHISLSGVVMEGSKSGMNNPHIALDGVGVRLEAPILRITGANGLGSATDMGVHVGDGAQYRTNGPYIRNCYKGIHAATGGVAPDLKINSMRLANINKDLHIEHTTTTGVFSGIAEFSKITNAAVATFSETYTDPTVGDYNISRTAHMRGFATDITEIATAATTTTLLSTDAHANVLTGSTLGKIIKLPDATTLRNGHQEWIINASSVIITTEQYDGASPITVYPSGTVKYILRNNSTAGGVWNRSISSAAQFQGTAPVICGYSANAIAGRYMDFIAGNSSNNSPFIIIAPATLVGMSIANTGGTTTAVVGIYEVADLVNPIATLSLIAQQIAFTSALAASLAAGNGLAVKIISGSMLKPFITFYLAGQ